ncbi:MAG TPA: response regulator [Candidatus Cloacimonadota bacterium]|nr:response regulator [Candidatus Cloacimonadota bacterium]HPT72643.1 response regulator [Candidatus Cloacimonadota bacterium]
MSYILVVDDDTNFRQMLCQTLERAGYRVVEAEDGNVAIKACETEVPGLVITDIIMPEKEGLETIQEIRAKYPEVNIIAMSGGGRISPDSYLPLAKGLGAVKTLQKPFRREEVIKAVQELFPQE